MPAYRCSTCGITYPPGASVCKVCDKTMHWLQHEIADTDWQDKVNALLEPPVVAGAEDGQVHRWRLLRFLDLGCTADDAETLAVAMHGDARVDLHDFARLVAAGCPVTLARSILL